MGEWGNGKLERDEVREESIDLEHGDVLFLHITNRGNR